MNSRQWKRVAHAAKKLGLQIRKPTGTESQSHTGDTKTQKRELRKKLSDRLLSIIWNPLIAILTVVGGITAINSLRYDVSIDSYASLNPKEPLETRFVLTNQGPFAIHKVHYACEFPAMKVPGMAPNINLVGADVVAFEEPEMEARGKISLRCENLIPLVDGSTLQIRVSYRPSFWPASVEGGSTFLLKRDSEGNAIWLPIGRLKSLEELKK